MIDINEIIGYEQGDLNDIQILHMFSTMIKNESVWSLQGHYGRTASALIEEGFITQVGELTQKALDFIDLNS